MPDWEDAMGCSAFVLEAVEALGGFRAEMPF